MDEKKIYIAGRKEAYLICDKCGKEKLVPVAAIQDLVKKHKVKCSCGHVFMVRFEKRRYFRKQASLKGKCRLPSYPAQSIAITITDLSRTGVGFTKPDSLDFLLNETVDLEFRLDNTAQDLIVCRAVIKGIVEKNKIGAEFISLPLHLQKLLGFYLI